MDNFFDRYNPHAQQVLLGNLLGAASRGQWEASAADKAQVASRLARSVAAHGIACEANMCRNPALTHQISQALEGVADGAALLDGYTRALREATTAPATPAASESETTNAVPAAPATAAAAPPASATPNRVGRSAPGQGLTSAAASHGAAPPPSAAPRPQARPSMAPLANAVPARSATAAASTNATMVTGRVMETIAQSAAPSPSRSSTDSLTEWILLAGISAISLILGWLRQARLAS
jgi:cobalamin biosynthesis Mg chelatase CobN